MLFRGHGVLSKIITITLLATTTYGESSTSSNSRSYDTNDWIPVSRPATPGEANQAENTQKQPTGRVLNLPTRDEKQYYLSDQQFSNLQNFRLPPEPVKTQQPPLLQSQRLYQPQPTYVPNGQQQILLPPQLQSFITQGQSYISPQKINQQLLRNPTQEYMIPPTRNSPQNSSNYNFGLHNQQVSQQSGRPNNEQQEIQLLYVPLENLQQQRGHQQQVAFPTEQTQVYKQQYESPVHHKQVQLQNIEQDFVQQALQAQKLEEQFAQNLQPVLQQNYHGPYSEATSQPQTTAASPKKRKPHQPPLAVYMGTEGHQDVKIGDVLSILKDAKTISVQDTVGPDSPQVFVGPSHLQPPEGYAKFDLPYLSSIENNRVERKVDHLPFFVAPLSYKAPPGYSKIPFPAPHVGSVVINHLKISPSTTTENSKYFQTLEESSSSQIPFSQSLEASTVRPTRGRQRQPTRQNYSPSPVQSSGGDNIPYGPLPTRIPEIQQSYSAEESFISTNPYGPTRFVQTTTPVPYEKPVALPEEIFSTKNRFTTTSSYNHNTHYSRRPEVQPTEPTIASSTVSSSLTDDKYTVLEQFPIRQKQIFQETESDTSNRGSNSQQFRRPSEDEYRIDSAEKTALPLISSTQFNTQYDFGSHTSKRQKVPENNEEHVSRGKIKQSAGDNYRENDEDASRQSYRGKSAADNYRETPTRQRVTENYNFVTQVAHSLPNQQANLHATQQSQVREQQHFFSPNYEVQLPLNHNSQQAQQTRGEQQHISDEYEQYLKEKTTEPLVSVTKEPVVEYRIPDEQVYQIPHIRNQQQQNKNSYYQDQSHQVVSSNQEYTLPDKLPPISPQLPGLINSLQDQQFRPLLAPLLIPPSDQTPADESKLDTSEEYYSSPAPVHIPVSTTTTSTTTTTATPITEATTQFRRTRPRQRGTRPTVAYDYVSTTATPQRSSQYRGRRPSTTQQRQYSSTAHSEATEPTTRATYNRNRVTQRQYVSSSTEQPRRSPITRQRFRTRGRPVKTDEVYGEKNTPENESAIQDNVYQSSGQTLHSNDQLNSPAAHITNFEATASQRPQTEQALIYVQSTGRPDSQLPDLYIPRQQFITSTESHELNRYSTIAATGPESNIVHDQPSIISAQQQIRINNNPSEINTNYQKDYSHKTEINDQSKYHVEPEYTTEFTRTKIRTRGKTRNRINPTVSTTKYQPSYSTTTTQKIEDGKEEEEFYGFFRKPNFGRPPQTERPDSDIISTNQTPKINNYQSRTTEEPYSKRAYYNQENSPVYSSPNPYPQDNYDESNIQVQRQYISSTTASSEESVTRRPAVRTRRPITSPTRSPESSEQSNERYNYRTSKRPEVTTTRPARIRSRIRIPSRSSAENQSSNNHASRSNELGNNSEEYVTPSKTRQRLTNRGKSHFQSPRSEKVTEEPEEENYPVSFLQGHGIQRQSTTVGYSTPAASTQQSIILTTPRPTFQLTIEPVDTEEYSDQVPYSSAHEPRIASKDLEHGGQESQFSSKFVEKPFDFNYIFAGDKSTTEKILETTLIPDNTTPSVSSWTEEAEVTTQLPESTTTDIPVTNSEVVTGKARRRGVWRLVKARPVADEFESAESQNIHSVINDNEFSNLEKPFRRYKVVQRIRTTTEFNLPETTTMNVPETTLNSQTETEKPSTEGSILAPLYEMFGYTYNSENHTVTKIEYDDATENPTIVTTLLDNIETTTLANNSTAITPLLEEDKIITYSDMMQDRESATSSTSDDSWESKIIGTSTSTEISHETEICYRGRCVKSASTEEDSAEKL